MKLVILSDTHGRHESLGTLSGDVLVHCGDAQEGYGCNPHELEAFDAWLGEQAFDHVLSIGGNHDFTMEQRVHRGQRPLHHAVVLQDEEVTIDGRRFYGSPWTPDLEGFAYYQPDDQLRERWAAIPARPDVLITHTPPVGILDRNRRGRSLGCPLLAEQLDRIRPRVHVFGHVHASRGICRRGETTYVNASQLRRDGLFEAVTLEL